MKGKNEAPVQSKAVALPAQLQPTNVLIYEYGARLDAECRQLVHDQLFMAHQLYNEIVAEMRQVVDEVRRIQFDRAGEPARVLQDTLDALQVEWSAAKAANDEDALTRIAGQRRARRGELWKVLAGVRSTCKEETKPILARIGRSSTCTSYQLRCKAVEQGLGWATANAVLDNALTAWKKTMSKGNAPGFSRFADKEQMTLTLQFTAAGGIPASKLLAGHHNELVIDPGPEAGRRSYRGFSFRLGAAKANVYATGTWQYHRPLPDGCSVGLVRLKVQRHADKMRYALQFMVKLPEPVRVEPNAKREPLVAIHAGWSAGDDGRRIAGVTGGADPGFASLLKLPASVELDLGRAAEIQSQRDESRDALVAQIKDWDIEQVPADVHDEVAAIRKLPAQHVSAKRLYRLAYELEMADARESLLSVLKLWRGEDRKAWQASVGLARRARNRRKNFYIEQAAALVSGYAAVALEMPDLKKAATKLDEETGEKTEFVKKARAGRVVAALYEFRQAVEWACTRTDTPLILVEGAATVADCPYCGGKTQASEEDWQTIHCHSCGAEMDRKLAGAARAWQVAHEDLDTHKAQFTTSTYEAWDLKQAVQQEKKQKVAEARKANREAQTASD